MACLRCVAELDNWNRCCHPPPIQRSLRSITLPRLSCHQIHNRSHFQPCHPALVRSPRRPVIRGGIAQPISPPQSATKSDTTNNLLWLPSAYALYRYMSLTTASSSQFVVPVKAKTIVTIAVIVRQLPQAICAVVCAVVHQMSIIEDRKVVSISDLPTCDALSRHSDRSYAAPPPPAPAPAPPPAPAAPPKSMSSSIF